MGTAIALGQQQCFPSFLFKYQGGRPGRHTGTGPELLSRLYSLKRETKKSTITKQEECGRQLPKQSSRGFAKACQSKPAGAYFMPTKLCQSVETANEYRCLHADLTQKVFPLWGLSDVIIQVLLRNPTREQNRSGTRCTSSEELLMEKSNYTNRISQSPLGANSLLRMANLFTFW